MWQRGAAVGAAIGAAVGAAIARRKSASPGSLVPAKLVVSTFAERNIKGIVLSVAF